MSTRASRQVVLQVLLLLASAACAHAGASAVIGTSWSGPPSKLQSIVDAAYGPGRINVQTDYLGAQPGEPDVIVWSSSVWPIVQVRELAGTERRAGFGWYVETGDGQVPVIDGVEDGPVYKNDRAPQATTVLQFRNRGRHIGFYLQSPDAGSGQGPRTFFTNRTLNDVGPGGTGALHEPLEGGDIQALVFDVSAWSRPLTWLVCFEERDSGAQPAACCGTTDNDFADYVVEVRAEATTPTLSATFGALKRVYRE